MGYEERFSDGPYKEHLVAFVEYKRGKGEKCARSLLVACAKISAALPCEGVAEGLDERTVRGVLERIEGESDTSREHRVSIMRQFCSFLTTLGITCWRVPPRYFTAPRSEFRPYILSEGDITSLLEAADSLTPQIRNHGYERSFPVLVRLLLSSGLRISEALALEVGSFSPGDGSVLVANSKNGVTRQVPLEAGMADRVGRFVRDSGRRSGPLFLSPHTGRAYTYDATYYMFRKLYSKSGVRTESGALPRIHDLRHTFCTRSLDKMLSAGMDVYEAVPILAAYVGHVNYANTEKYLHLTAAGHGSFVDAERRLASLIPGAVM